MELLKPQEMLAMQSRVQACATISFTAMPLRGDGFSHRWRLLEHHGGCAFAHRGPNESV